MIRFAAASLAFFMLAAPALAVEFEPNDQGFTEFNMPSGNIGCFYTPAGGTDVYKTVGRRRGTFLRPGRAHPICA